MTNRLDLVERLLACAVLVWIAIRTLNLLGQTWSFATDDAYITLRYARHLAEGHGIVWNVGDHPSVEGYSNFLFVLFGAAAVRMHLDPMLVLKAVGCCSLLGTIPLLYALSRRWLSPLPATLAPAMLTACKGTIFWAGSGLETAFFQLCVIAATLLLCLALDAQPGAPAAPKRPSRSATAFAFCAAICCAASLTRPEGPLVAIVVGGTAIGDRLLRVRRSDNDRERSDRTRDLRQCVVAFAVCFAMPYALYFAWRVATFHRLLPNTVYCKAAYHGDPWYLDRHFWLSARGFVLLALIQNPRRLGLKALPLYLTSLVYAAALFGADPIIGYYERHFLGALALLLVASSIGAVNLVLIAGWIARRLLGFAGEHLAPPVHGVLQAAFAPRALLALFVGWWLASDGTLSRKVGMPLATQASEYARRMRARHELGEYLDESLGANQSFLIGDAGLVGFLTHSRVIDAFCLNSREMTSPAIHRDTSLFLDWLFKARPDVLVVHSSDDRELVAREEYDLYPALVRDPRFSEGYERDRIFGASDDTFFYWLFRRRDPAGHEAAGALHARERPTRGTKLLR